MGLSLPYSLFMMFCSMPKRSRSRSWRRMSRAKKMVTSKPMEITASRFQLPAIVTDNLGSCNCTMTWHDGWVTSLGGQIGASDEGEVAFRWSTLARVLDPSSPLSSLPFSTGQALPASGDQIEPLTEFLTRGVAYPWGKFGVPPQTHASRFNYTCGRFFGPQYVYSGMQNYGITMNPRYRDFSSGDITGRGVHLHGIRFRMQVVFPPMSTLVRETDYCSRKVSWMLCLLPESDFPLDPQWYDVTKLDDDEFPRFPSKTWEPIVSTIANPGVPFRLDPLNSLVEVSRFKDRYRSFFAQDELMPVLSENTCYGGSAYPTPQSRVDDYLRHKWRLRSPGTGKEDTSFQRYMPTSVVVLGSGVVEESNPRHISLTTMSAPVVQPLVPPAETGWTSVANLDPTTGIPTLLSHTNTHTTSAFVGATSEVTEPMAGYEESIHRVSVTKKFDKPLFVDYSSNAATSRWIPFVQSDSEPESAPFYTNVSGINEDPRFSETYTPSLSNWDAIATDPVSPAVSKLFLPSYACGLPSVTPEGPLTEPTHAAIPFKNRIALFVWDNMPRSASNQFRPRVVPTMHRYETDA